MYAFTDNEGPTIRNSGAPELMLEYETSFGPEQEWLDDARWYHCEARCSDESETSSEVKNDLRLHSTPW